MRALRLIAVLALFGAAPSPSPSPSAAVPSPTPTTSAEAKPIVALHAGDAVTLAQLFSYLAPVQRRGEWLRYRVSFAGGPSVVKTIGFGSESVGGIQTLFIETRVHSFAVTGLPALEGSTVGTDAILKTYVAGDAFGDLNQVYSVVTSAIKIGALEYEVPAATPQQFSALTGDVYSQPRQGVVRSIAPVDVAVGSRRVHASEIVASFEPIPLPAGGVSDGFTLDIWQSPDVSAGTVAIESAGPQPVSMRLLDSGSGYRSSFSRTLDQIRAQGQPTMP